jgi:NAD(P)-dependent dehydrogenase (short-subunit alcohol dehydrogenase family)
VARVFERVRIERGRLDVLANGVWGGYDRMVENGQFTWPKPFWEQPLWRWHAMFDAGVRPAFVASQHAARLMLPHRRGLIVHLSHWAAQKHLGNVIYGMSKAATDKMTADMAHELIDRSIAVVSLYPGLVRTEMVMAYAAAFDLSNSESPEFTGRAITALTADPELMRRTGHAITVARLALDYGFTDIDGKQPRPLTIDEV